MKMQVEGSGSLYVHRNGNLQITFDYLPNNAHICVNKNDIQGNVCYPSVENACQLCPNYIKLIRQTNNTDMITIQTSIQYETLGVKNVQITAKNSLSTISENMTTFVTSSEIPISSFELAFSNPNYMSPSTPLRFISSFKVKITALLELKNEHIEHDVAIKWTLEKVNDTTLGQIGNFINISSVNSLILTLPESLLRPGFYRVTCYVDLINKNTKEMIITRNIAAYLLALQPPIIIRMLEFNSAVILIGSNDKLLCLDPGKYSYDPAIIEGNKNVVNNLIIIML